MGETENVSCHPYMAMESDPDIGCLERAAADDLSTDWTLFPCVGEIQ